MSQETPGWVWKGLLAAVLTHLIVSMIHGAAHQGAHVPLTRLANVFVFGVIVAGPLVGIALIWFAERLGYWIVAATMAASLVFGCVNHFVLAGTDHVAHVDAEWRVMFGATAVLLALTEALGAVLALRLVREGGKS